MWKFILQVLKLIRKGAFGVVFQVKQLNSNDKLYAMKILKKSKVSTLYYYYYLRLLIT